MKDPIVRLDPGTGEHLQQLVCRGCGAVGNAIDGKWSDDARDLSLAPGSEQILFCDCGSNAFYVTQHTITNREETR